MVFLVLYVIDILVIRNDVGLFSSVKIWLSTQSQMKNLGKVQYIVKIKVFRGHKNRKIGLS